MSFFFKADQYPMLYIQSVYQIKTESTIIYIKTRNLTPRLLDFK